MRRDRTLAQFPQHVAAGAATRRAAKERQVLRADTAAGRYHPQR